MGIQKNAVPNRLLNRLLKELPEGASQRFTDLGKIADGLYRAKALENTSKTARDLIGAMDNPRTISKIYSGVGQAAMAEGATTSLGFPGVGAMGVIAKTLMKSKTPATMSADQFLGSPALRQAIDLVARGDVAGANRLVAKSPQFSAWAATLPANEAERIARIGFISWITSADEDAE